MNDETQWLYGKCSRRYIIRDSLFSLLMKNLLYGVYYVYLYSESPRVSSLIVNALLKCQRFCSRMYTPCSIVPHMICMDILWVVDYSTRNEPKKQNKTSNKGLTIISLSCLLIFIQLSTVYNLLYPYRIVLRAHFDWVSRNVTIDYRNLKKMICCRPFI